jgi:ketosteroid isomerase-like protein
MSQENVELVRDFFDRFNAFMRGELTTAAFGEAMDPEIQLHWRDEQTYPDTPQHLLGAAEVIAFSEQYRNGWVDLVSEPLEIIEAPADRVLVLTRQRGRGHESGVPIVVHFFAVYTTGNGKLRQIEYFRHRADAFEAAGLRE